MSLRDDQAASLRRLLAHPHQACSFAFIGHSGSGVSTIVAELASVLAQHQQQRVLIIDGQPDPQIARRFRLDRTRRLEQIMYTQGSVDDAMYTLPCSTAELINLYLSPKTFSAVAPSVEQRLHQEFSARVQDIQWVMIDPPTVEHNPALAALSDHLVIVLTPSQASFTHCYNAVRLLSEDFGRRAFNILINRANSLEDAQHDFRRLAYAASEYLNVSLRWVGFIPEDYHFRRAQIMKTTAVHAFPSSEGAIACQQLASALPLWSDNLPGDAQNLFGRLIEAMRHLYESDLTPVSDSLA